MNINNDKSKTKLTTKISQDESTKSLIKNFLSAQPQASPATIEICYQISWQIPYETKFGECIAIVGNAKELGNWMTENALKLHWSDNNIWKGSAIIDLNQEYDEKHILEYKYILVDEAKKTVIWEDGLNRFYYYSQIKNESFPKNECICEDLKLECSKKCRINTNNKIIFSSQNSNQTCCHEMKINDAWNKKIVTFRILQENLSDTDSVIGADDYSECFSNQKLSQIDINNPQTEFKVNEINYYNTQVDQKSTSSFKSPFSSTETLSSGKLDQDSEIQYSTNNSNDYIKQDQYTRQISYLITGNHKALGGIRNPQKMNYNPKLKCWEFQALVERDIEYIRYFYIKKDSDNHFLWEKGSGRFIYMLPLNDPSNLNASAINKNTSSPLQSSHNISDHDFVAIKNEILSSPILRANKIHPTHKIDLFNQESPYKQINCTCCNPKLQNSQLSNRMTGKMHVNTLKKGSFVTEDQEESLDFSLKFDKINEQLYLGPYVSNNECEIKQLKQAGIDTVLSLQTDEDMSRRQVDKHELKEQYKINNIEYYNIPIKDKSFKDFLMKSQDAVDKLYNLLRNKKRIVYLHCTGGISRAPQTAILYLSLYKNFSLKNSTKFVCNKREQAYPDKDLLLQAYNKSYDNLMNNQYVGNSN